MLNDVECQLDQPNTVKSVSLYLTAPGSNPGARILKIMLLQLCELCISDTYPESNSAICVLGMAQLCELRTSDTYSASNVTSFLACLLAWRSAAMRITHFGHPSRKAAGEARTENILHRSRHRIVDVRRDT